MEEELSEYERQRLANIQRNEETAMPQLMPTASAYAWPICDHSTEAPDLLT